MNEIALVGDFSADLDEGYKNTAHHLAKQLEASGQLVAKFNVKQASHWEFWNAARHLRPILGHVFSQPTDASLGLIRALRFLWPQTKFVLSALKADRYLLTHKGTALDRLLMRLAAPDLVLVQSAEHVLRFTARGVSKVARLPGGVDPHRFHPASDRRRRDLRGIYGLRIDLPVVLHVGHLHVERNLQALIPIARAGIQVLVAGSVYKGAGRPLIEQIRSGGLTVLPGYQQNVEELYQLADLYAFPASVGNSLDLPLSVLEAMATNLPVVTTRYPAILEAFGDAPDVHVADDTVNFAETIMRVLADHRKVENRSRVTNFSWEAVGGLLRGYYADVLAA